MDISGRHSIHDGKEYRGDTNGRGWIFPQVSKSTCPSGYSIVNCHLIVFGMREGRCAQKLEQSSGCYRNKEKRKDVLGITNQISM